MDAANPAAASTTSPHGLPDEVITCLQNARFLHLATCADNVPHISLMNYTYLPSTPYSATPIIIMTTPPSSRKTLNIELNPSVSLLVHDWVSHRPPTLSQPGRSPSPTRPGPRSGSLAELLLGMNTASLSRISTTINGTAQMVASGSEEEKWYREQHLANNTFGPSDDDNFSSSPVGGGLWGGGGLRGGGHAAEDDETREGDGGTKCYVEGEEVRVVVVKIKDGRIADWKGQVRDWVVARDGSGLTNGV
ncbi:pyridoxamine phosphate oxidase-like protein [Corynespora cassiicola Philippines]|uniref:Pyridoxamine phosphate oxidase-like protein n=1 Tax=Corynespora cassiicola Philippines TaxID=1448308 RepID=A0A2T2NXQ4_CORCC|nr:pyridoxamine phosphate oxidase-like protein [Corynespora cassiicola Philippines]